MIHEYMIAIAAGPIDGFSILFIKNRTSPIQNPGPDSIFKLCERCSISRDHRPHSQRFCDVALRVKFYYDCDVAKSLRMGPNLKTNLPEVGKIYKSIYRARK